MTNKGGGGSGGGAASGESLYLTGNISGFPPAAPPPPPPPPHRFPLLLCRRPRICQLSEVDGGAAEKMGRDRNEKKVQGLMRHVSKKTPNKKRKQSG